MHDEEAFISPKSRLVTLVLAGIVGVFGVHRFYVGKIGSGIAMACTLGGLGIWYIYDLVMIIAGSFKDAEGRLITEWEPARLAGVSTAAVLDELDALRAEVNDLHERLEFAERLLSDPNRTAPPR